MSWFGFHALSSAWLFLLVGPLVLFYFLKLRRPRLDVPSLFLWSQVLNDQRVNSPFQRVKRNLRLLVQLLLLLLLILAAMQPFWRGRPSRALRLPVLIDCSASMAALDRPGGVSRLDAAKSRVRKLIDEMPPGQELCLIAFSRLAHRATGFTDNPRILRSALDQIEIEDVGSDIEAPLRLAQGLARSVAFDEVLLFSDGNFPSRADFELSFKIDYQRLPPAGPNVGITAFGATRSAGGDWHVFLGLEGSAATDASATVEIRGNGEVVGKERVTITKGQAERITLSVPGDRPAALEARLVPDGFDSLAADNTAFLDLPATRSLWVYASPSLEAYRHALKAIPTVRLFPEEGATAAESRYDLVITDRAEDLALEARTCLTVGVIPPDLQTLLSLGDQGTEIVDWRRNATVLQHVELSDLVVLDRLQSRDGVGAADYENLGYEILADGQRGPLLLEKHSGPKLVYHLLFHTDRSTLPYRIGFPILVSNLVQVALTQAGLAKAEPARTGVLPPTDVGPGSACTVHGPDGSSREQPTDSRGLLAGTPALRVGRYRIVRGGDERARIGASLLSPSETRLASVEELVFNEDLSVAAATEPLRADRSLWWPLALVALGVLLGEWWLFQRRPGGWTR